MGKPHATNPLFAIFLSYESFFSIDENVNNW